MSIGEYNKLRIIANGNHVEHWLNGVAVHEYKWGSQELTELVAHSKFNKFPGSAQIELSNRDNSFMGFRFAPIRNIVLPRNPGL